MNLQGGAFVSQSCDPRCGILSTPHFSNDKSTLLQEIENAPQRSSGFVHRLTGTLLPATSGYYKTNVKFPTLREINLGIQVVESM